ncbi:hypothetical protein Sulku_1219 [Sulfuricurvum kujiense DSM 16994]|uniref:Uncharacterized protein n=1 Tax=Sulfuricurvum kujiense (strain ATCC BAA-921 / DSM 16994 / JCM 11577 / YK-1) TaxID=709032 RepID=E4TXH3_SULKY|nr:hypothetical protein [Sulfuricurvum kujiense]ADR33882.1 hypothetical protein Sulku_1219 [Sulfuricurvum kujiense DSM 16994]
MSNFFKAVFSVPFLQRLEKLRLFACDRVSLLRRILCPIYPLVYADDVRGEISAETLVVLSPKEYWVMEASLNVSTEKEAIKYAPALFDLGENHLYQAKKTADNSYLLLAYNPKEVENKIRKNPILSNAQKVTFAQWVFGDLDKPVRLNNNRYLSVVDGIVLEMEVAYLSKHGSITLEEALRSPQKSYKSVSLSTLISDTPAPKTFKMSLFVLLLLSGNFFFQAVNDHLTIAESNAKIEALLNSSHLSATSIERDVILRSLREKEETQLALRQKCYAVSMLDIPLEKAVSNVPATLSGNEGIVLIPGSKPGDSNRLLIDGKTDTASAIGGMTGFSELLYDGKTLKITLDAADDKRADEIKSIVLKKFKHSRINEQNHKIEVRIK